MNADQLKRLFRAINEGSEANMRKIAVGIIAAERQKGHAVLADQLDELLHRPTPGGHADSSPSAPKIDRPAGLATLPTNRRNQDPLVTWLPQERLRHHMVLPTDIETRFQRIETEFAARERLARYGLQPRRKILLYGPPGCGKSLGAERLAWTTGLPFVKVRFDSIMSSFFGESAANLRTVFETTLKEPCLLFLDECDFVARSRTSGNDVGEVPRIVNTLLQLLEDYQAPGLLIAATNLDTALDRAIFRRFDDVFEVPLPGHDEIVRLLQTTLSVIAVANDIDWSPVIARLEGMSAANVVKAAQDAAKGAVLAGNLPVRQVHLVTAIEELHRST